MILLNFFLWKKYIKQSISQDLATMCPHCVPDAGRGAERERKGEKWNNKKEAKNRLTLKFDIKEMKTRQEN